MKVQYDVLIVGSGIYGSTCAYELSRRGLRCLVLEKRRYIGGNCRTELRDGINIHAYGPHIFHTSHQATWDWINRFATFNNYRHRVKVQFADRLYSFPPNLSTFHELWGVTTPEQAKKFIEKVRIPTTKTQSLEKWILSQVGREIYEIFFKGYTRKQWNREPRDLPASIVKRIPIRFSFDDNYYQDSYQGIPIGGYTPIFAKLLSNSDVWLETDYFSDRKAFDSIARAVLYTGSIDRFYNCRFGALEYRSVRFVHRLVATKDFQGVAQINFTSEQVPYTRVVEHKHFESVTQPHSWVTAEYPADPGPNHDEMYPIRDEANITMLRRYQCIKRDLHQTMHFFGGRLAEYRYYDMHQAIAAALLRSAEIYSVLGASGVVGPRCAVNRLFVGHMSESERGLV